MHAFNGELFVQATRDTSPSRLFRTQFRMVPPEAHQQPEQYRRQPNRRAGVQINDSGAALGYYVNARTAIPLDAAEMDMGYP